MPTPDLVPDELWRTVGGFEDYEVSNFGKVRRVGAPYRKSFGRCLYQRSDKQGYRMVYLCKNGEKYAKKVHRIVLIAFCGPCPEGMECAHLDGTKDNNRIENLKWVTCKENHYHKRIHGNLPRGEGHTSSKLNNDLVREMRSRRKAGEKVASLSRYFGIVESAVSAICNRKRWQHVN